MDPWFLIGSSSVWNGIALGTIDIAKRHTTRKRHVDVGMRVADYPTIQDYVGEAVMDTNACRVFVLSVAQAMDRATDDNTRVLEPGETARADYLHWAWQIKFEAAKNVAHVVDKMLHACGGSGYKRDMELERYVRDAKAGWVMGPTNEVLRQFVGKAVLLGFDALDYWNQTYNRRVVENEVKKLDSADKRELAAKLSRRPRRRGQGRGGEGVAMAVAVDRRARWRRAEAGRPGPGVVLGRPGAATAVRLRRDDRLTVINRDGGQVAELTVLDPEGARTRGDRRPRRCAGHGAARADAGGADGLPRGATRAGPEARTTRAPCGCSAPTPARRVAGIPRRARGDRDRGRSRRPRGGRRSARLGAGGGDRRAIPRSAAEIELPPPLAEPRLDFRVDLATALAYEVGPASTSR